jgi:hypothetical protein
MLRSLPRPIGEAVQTVDEFTTVFLFTQEQETSRVFRWSESWGLIGCVGIATAVFIVFLQFNHLRKEKITSVKAFLRTLFSLLFTGLWLLFWTSMSVSMLTSGASDYTAANERYQHLLNIYNSQQYQIVEGLVHVLHTQPETGHDRGDVVEVGGVEFEVDYFLITFGYNKTLAYGGVLGGHACQNLLH